MQKSTQSKISLLEIGRGFAALLVVFHHASRIMAQDRFYGQQPFDGWMEFFYVGVDFFFVLSGFIMAWVHFDDLGQPDKVGPFLWKRFMRIYPPYWVILLPLAAAYFMFPSSGVESQRDPVNLLMSVLLLPYPAPPILGVAWTLVHEVFFYILFAVAIVLGKRAFWIIMSSWAVAILAGSFVPALPHPVSFFLSPFNIEFIIGICIAVVVRRYRIPLPQSLMLAGIALFCLFIFLPVIHENQMVGRLAFGAAAALFVAGAVQFEANRSVRFPAILTFLGAASYAIYLIHPIVLSAAVQILRKLTGTILPVDIAVWPLVAAAALAGCVFHLAIEKPLIQAIRRRRGRRLSSA